jgi:hypothetical protein
VITYRNIYKYLIFDNCNMKYETKRRMGLAGLMFGGATSLINPALAFANEVGQSVQAEQENEQEKSEPILLATFENKSIRPEYKDKEPFRYNLFFDDERLYICREDEPETKFSPRWFYDIGGEGFGKEELDWMKSGKLVYMNPEFNKIANERIRNTLDFLINRPLELEVPEEREGERSITPVADIVMGLSANPNSFGFNLGGRYNFNNTWGLGLGLDLILYPGKETLNVITPMSEKGIYTHITKSETGGGFGPYAELKAGPVIFKGGFNYWLNTEDSTVQGMRYDERLGNPVKSMVPVREFSGFGEIDFRIPSKTRFGLEAGVGYDNKRGLYGAVSVTERQRNRPKRENKK